MILRTLCAFLANIDLKRYFVYICATSLIESMDILWDLFFCNCKYSEAENSSGDYTSSNYLCLWLLIELEPT